jgi:hypothetical protein
MAEKEDLTSKLAALEARLRVPEKAKISGEAAEAGKLRAKALGLPERIDAAKISQQIAALGDRSDLVVEWRVHDVDAVSSSVAVACCCCCCCCCYVGA